MCDVCPHLAEEAGLEYPWWCCKDNKAIFLHFLHKNIIICIWNRFFLTTNLYCVLSWQQRRD